MCEEKAPYRGYDSVCEVDGILDENPKVVPITLTGKAIIALPFIFTLLFVTGLGYKGFEIIRSIFTSAKQKRKKR